MCFCGIDRKRREAYPSLMATPKRANTVILSEYEQGRLDERKAIEKKILEDGYDWSHDTAKTGFSPLQSLLNWLYKRV